MPAALTASLPIASVRSNATASPIDSASAGTDGTFDALIAREADTDSEPTASSSDAASPTSAPAKTATDAADTTDAKSTESAKNTPPGLLTGAALFIVPSQAQGQDKTPVPANDRTVGPTTPSLSAPVDTAKAGTKPTGAASATGPGTFADALAQAEAAKSDASKADGTKSGTSISSETTSSAEVSPELAVALARLSLDRAKGDGSTLKSAVSNASAQGESNASGPSPGSSVAGAAGAAGDRTAGQSGNQNGSNPSGADTARTGQSEGPAASDVTAAANSALADTASPSSAPQATTPSAPASVPPAPAASVSLSSLSLATIQTTTQIAAQITRQLNGKSTRFEMGLTPEGLGRVDVSLDIDATGRLTARLAFDNPLAATDLRGRADELRSQLQEAGFKVANDSLTFSQRDPSSDGQTSDGGASNRRQNRAFATASRIGDTADLTSAPAWVSLSLTPSGVDMKV